MREETLEMKGRFTITSRFMLIILLCWISAIFLIISKLDDNSYTSHDKYGLSDHDDYLHERIVEGKKTLKQFSRKSDAVSAMLRILEEANNISSKLLTDAKERVQVILENNRNLFEDGSKLDKTISKIFKKFHVLQEGPQSSPSVKVKYILGVTKNSTVDLFVYVGNSRGKANRTPIHQPFSRTVVLSFSSRLCKSESNTTFDWLNRKLVCIIWRRIEKTLPSSNASNASKRPKTLQTPLPTFPISATTLIIFGFLFINLFRKKYSLIFISHDQHDERYKNKPTD